MEKNSSFLANPWIIFFHVILRYITIIFTFSLLYPFAFCLSERYITDNTIIDGKRLKFVGKTKDIYWQYLKWLFLSIITLGLLTFNLSFRLKKWKCQNTKFIDEVDCQDSKFSGYGIDNSYIKITNFLLIILSVGLLTPYALKRKYSWVKTNTYINGKQLHFKAEKKDFYLHYLKWYGLVIITLGIYLVYFFNNVRDYIIKHSHISKDQEKIDVTSPTDWFKKLLKKPKLLFVVLIGVILLITLIIYLLFIYIS